MDLRTDSPLPAPHFSPTMRGKVQFSLLGSGDMAEDCIFCKIARKEVPADILFEDSDLIAFSDVNPQAPTHLLVVPKKHIPTVNDLTETEAPLIGALVLRAQALAAERGIDDAGYRLVMNCNAEGGQTVFHIHLHLLGGRQLRRMG